jgi:hypothetical protein
MLASAGQVEPIRQGRKKAMCSSTSWDEHGFILSNGKSIIKTSIQTTYPVLDLDNEFLCPQESEAEELFADASQWFF